MADKHVTHMNEKNHETRKTTNLTNRTYYGLLSGIIPERLA
jgi:hypothetical protein